MEIHISGWFGFWIFCAVFVVCEAFLMMRGIDTFTWQFRTAPELRLQNKLIDKQCQSTV